MSLLLSMERNYCTVGEWLNEDGIYEVAHNNMPKWAIILISVIGVYIIAICIIHRHVIKAIINHKPFKAPKWHVWLPKSMRVE